MRETYTGQDVMAGCFQCNGNDAIWTNANAQGVAARHHDATGHTTWVDRVIFIQYGPHVGEGRLQSRVEHE